MYPGIFDEAASIEFDERGLKYHSAEHGITIIIPEDAVSGKARLRVGVTLVGPFHFPDNYTPVSAVAWINTSVPLQKRAELHMPHFVLLQDEEDTKELSFFLASDQSYGEFEFTEVPHYPSSFKPGSSYGTLWVDHFCSGCILKKKDVKQLMHHYYIARVLPNDRDRNEWATEIVFSYFLKSCIKVCPRLCEVLAISIGLIYIPQGH